MIAVWQKTLNILTHVGILVVCQLTLLSPKDTSLIDWYPEATEERIVAIGHASGTVSVTGLKSSERGELSAGLYSRRDFSPRSARHCTQVQWNPAKNNLLAVGLDRFNKEPSLMLWDVSTRLVR